MPESTAPDSLSQVLAAHGMQIPEACLAPLEQYCQLLWGWNEKLNLTRHTTFEQFVTRDLPDCLALSAALPPGEHVLDVGTGGGVPGVVLAILRPDLKVAACESIGKKALAVQDMVFRLRLPMQVYHARLEVVLKKHKYRNLVARAVAPLPEFLTWLKPHWGKVRRLLLIKGGRWPQELEAAQTAGGLAGLHVSVLKQYPTVGRDDPCYLVEVRAEDAK